MDNDPICVQCGEYKSVIRRLGLYCVSLGPDTESGSGEAEQEWSRHRFKPYSGKELEAIRKDEEEYCKQMGDMSDFFKKN